LTLDTVDNLGLLYRDQDKLDDAEQMYLRALAGYEKVLGADHTLTLDTVDNLGLLYHKQNKLDKAQQMYNRTLARKEKEDTAAVSSTQ
jgi:tetratricopeptide (TPR) repeat protein